MRSSSLAGVCLALALLPLSAQAASPHLVSLSPTSGGGQTQTFTVTASDADGAADIAGMNLLINTSFDGTGACWLYYSRAGGLAVSNDFGGWGSGGNSECTAQVASASDSGTESAVSINVTFNAHWTGNRNVYANVGDKEGNNSGYQQMGTYTIVAAGPIPDFTISMTPMSQTTEPGQTLDYNIIVTSVNGFTGDVIWNATYDPQPPGITVVPYDAKKFAVQSFVHVPPNGSGSGIMEVRTSTSTPPTNNIIFTLDFTNQHIEHTYQVQLSILTAAAPQISLSPTSGSGSTQTFTVTAVDQGGYNAISGINFLMNAGFDGAHACWLYYDNQRHSLALASDDASNWSNSTGIDSNSTTAGSIQNSQCAVYGGPVTASGSGDTLTLTITLTFSSTFTGAKQVWVRAGDVLGPDSGYQHLGDWTAIAGSSAPDFQVLVSPGSQTVNGGSTSLNEITIRGVNGYSGTPNLSVTGLPPQTTLTPPPNVPPGRPAFFYVGTTERTPPGDYTLTVTGTDGALSHSTPVVLTIPGAAIPTLSASPNSGAGTTQTFTFTATGQDQASAPVALNILINDAVNGQHACWISVVRTPQLASDDGSAWMTPDSSGTMQNSQCTVSNIQGNNPDFGQSITATLTFKGSFAGTKNIFLYSANAHGGDTGYQLQGTWTVQ